MIERDGKWFDEFGNEIPNFLININSESANVNETSFVSNPATERNFIAFSKQIDKTILAKYEHLPKHLLIGLKNVKNFDDKTLELFYKEVVNYMFMQTFAKQPIGSLKFEKTKNKSNHNETIFELGRALNKSVESFTAAQKELETKQKQQQNIVYLDELEKVKNDIVQIYKNEKFGFDYSEMF